MLPWYRMWQVRNVLYVWYGVLRYWNLSFVPTGIQSHNALVAVIRAFFKESGLAGNLVRGFAIWRVSELPKSCEFPNFCETFANSVKMSRKTCRTVESLAYKRQIWHQKIRVNKVLAVFLHYAFQAKKLHQLAPNLGTLDSRHNLSRWGELLSYVFADNCSRIVKHGHTPVDVHVWSEKEVHTPLTNINILKMAQNPFVMADIFAVAGPAGPGRASAGIPVFQPFGESLQVCLGDFWGILSLNCCVNLY